MLPSKSRKTTPTTRLNPTELRRQSWAWAFRADAEAAQKQKAGLQSGNQPSKERQMEANQTASAAGTILGDALERRMLEADRADTRATASEAR